MHGKKDMGGRRKLIRSLSQLILELLLPPKLRHEFLSFKWHLQVKLFILLARFRHIITLKKGESALEPIRNFIKLFLFSQCPFSNWSVMNEYVQHLIGLR